MHYYIRNQVSQEKIKQLEAKLKETLMKEEEKSKLDFLADAFLIELHSISDIHGEFLEKFCANLDKF